MHVKASRYPGSCTSFRFNFMVGAKGVMSPGRHILAALHRLVHTHPEPGSVDENWADVHGQFHKALVAACDSKWLLQVREQLFVQAERYRWINVRMSPETRDLGDEHREIAEAAIRRDLPRTCELMEHHLRLTETMTLEALAAAASASLSVPGARTEGYQKAAA